MRAAVLLTGSVLLAFVAVTGIFVFEGRPGAGDFVPANQMAAFTAGIFLVVAVVAGAVGLLVYASQE